MHKMILLKREVIRVAGGDIKTTGGASSMARPKVNMAHVTSWSQGLNLSELIARSKEEQNWGDGQKTSNTSIPCIGDGFED
ncbi:MAG: hypothetical protein JSW39_23220 [Desulfobacterales bacterium]|nr:MAG: hypothetical protein JSW39_23220 [Desulfobacterales bacterium]